MIIDGILQEVRKTNPGMTREKLMEELKKNNYSTISLIMIMDNCKVKEGCHN